MIAAIHARKSTNSGSPMKKSVKWARTSCRAPVPCESQWTTPSVTYACSRAQDEMGHRPRNQEEIKGSGVFSRRCAGDEPLYTEVPRLFDWSEKTCQAPVSARVQSLQPAPRLPRRIISPPD